MSETVFIHARRQVTLNFLLLQNEQINQKIELLAAKPIWRSGNVLQFYSDRVVQGVGVALLIVQGLAGVYSMVVTSWMFVYFRDSFVTPGESYRWTQCQAGTPAWAALRHCTHLTNTSWRIEETIPDYFAATVLQRSAPALGPATPGLGSLKFQVAFNLVVIWMIVFICLSKGSKFTFESLS